MPRTPQKCSTFFQDVLLAWCNTYLPDCPRPDPGASLRWRCGDGMRSAVRQPASGSPARNAGVHTLKLFSLSWGPLPTGGSALAFEAKGFRSQVLMLFFRRGTIPDGPDDLS